MYSPFTFCSFFLSFSLSTLSISPIVPQSSINAFQPAHNAANDRLFPLLTELVTSPYFRYVKIDLTKACPFWKVNSQCMNRDCNVVIMDEDVVRHDAPFMYRNVNLGDVKLSNGFNKLTDPTPIGAMMSNCLFSKDFCIPEDEHSTNGVYVDLVENPERFTGYSGVSANTIWSAIYDENCFGVTAKSAFSLAPSSNICHEKRTFYKIISGLHASISIHICSQYLNKVTGKWERNHACYWQRVGQFPDRVNNVYFVHALLLRATAKISPFLSTMDICTGNPEKDQQAKSILASITETAAETLGFDESILFQGRDALPLVNEVRTKFRNVSMIMDCVSCQKCRLWGKTQVTGLGTALKVLFGINPRILSGELSPLGPILSRFEVVALINTLNRLVESVHDIQIFNHQRRMFQLNQDPIALNSFTAPEGVSLKSSPFIPNQQPAKGTWINDDTLSVWKVVASVLTAMPFVFGAIYGVKRSSSSVATHSPLPHDQSSPTESPLPHDQSSPIESPLPPNQSSPTACFKHNASYSDSGIGTDQSLSQSLSKYFYGDEDGGYKSDSSNSSGLSAID